MKFDKLSLFADGLVVADDASTTTYSKVIDFRKCNLIDGCLKVFACIVGTANTVDASHGAVTTKLQVSADGATWTDLISWTQDGEILAAAFLPIKGKKRFARLAFVVTTALSGDIKVKAGLVDQFEVTELPSTQTYPPLEDLTVLGDKMEQKLVIGTVSGSATAGTAATLTAPISAGAITGMECADSTITYSVSGSTLSIKTTAATTAASKTAYFIDGLGNKVSVSFTVAS